MDREFIDKYFSLIDQKLYGIQEDIKYEYRSNCNVMLCLYIEEIRDVLDEVEDKFRAQRDRVREQELSYTEKWLEEIFSDPEELEILKSLAER